MTRPARKMLRRATLQDDSRLLGDHVGDGFILRNTSIRRMRGTNAPVHFFHVLDHQGSRFGIASLVIEPSIDAVRDFGHVCVTLAKDRSSSELLVEVAKLIVNVAYSLGLRQLRIVVPHDHPDSISACNALGPHAPAERHDCDEKSLLAYQYQLA